MILRLDNGGRGPLSCGGVIHCTCTGKAEKVEKCCTTVRSRGPGTLVAVAGGVGASSTQTNRQTNKHTTVAIFAQAAAITGTMCSGDELQCMVVSDRSSESRLRGGRKFRLLKAKILGIF